MSDDVWERHVNPWSVWTRYAALPLLIAAIWSRTYIGWWSIFPIAIMLWWIWINPRFFAPPVTTKSWASKAVLGERVWLNRENIPIPGHHTKFIRVLNVVTSVGSIVLLYGLVVLNGSSTAVGACVVIMGKSWFLDRMVWLYDDMSQKHEKYRDWLY